MANDNIKNEGLFYLSKTRKPNYQLKAKVIELGIDKDLKQISKAKYIYNSLYEKALEEEDFDFEFEYFKARKYTLDISMAYNLERKLQKEYDVELLEEGARVNNADYKRKNRLEHKIADMLETSENCVFLTLTFTDDVLNNTTPETRKKYVRRFLKSQSNNYIANIDFGKKTEREHYHALVSNKVNNKAWKYGSIDFERARYRNDSSVKMSKYISKLTNHAIKETTKRCCIIYSR